MSSLSETLAPELPFLRRFARALCGTQDSGDAYVVAMLEALVEDRSLFPNGLAARTAIYRTFLKVWNSVAINGTADVASTDRGEEGPDRRIELLSSRPRQAFLLVALEGFTLTQAAAVMDIPMKELSDLIDVAGREIAEQVATNVVIIEDEPLIAMDLTDIVTSLGHEVSEVATTHREAVAAVARQKPGLVLADVQLADGSSGLEAVREILSTISVPVIFITAFPERLLTGERPEPTFLINKPFQPEMVKAVISQALFFRSPVRTVNGTTTTTAPASNDRPPEASAAG